MVEGELEAESVWRVGFGLLAAVVTDPSLLRGGIPLRVVLDRPGVPSAYDPYQVAA
jgi:hypothetical protein